MPKPKFTSTLEIKPLAGPRPQSQLWLHTATGDTRVYSSCVASGDPSAIEAFVAGRIDWNQLCDAIHNQPAPKGPINR